MRRSLKLYGIAALLMIGIAVGCKHNKQMPVPANAENNNSGSNGDSSGNGNNDPVDTGICFKRDILPIFIAKCSRCHNDSFANEGYRFNSYESIISKKFKPFDPDDCELYEKITEGKEDERMPPRPNPRLDDKDVALIRRWILEGALNTDCNINASGCDSTKFGYANAVALIIEKNCNGCHNSSTASGGIALDNYNGVRAIALDGRLQGVINHSAGFPPMPRGGNKLSDCNIWQIEKWIADGAPDN